MTTKTKGKQRRSARHDVKVPSARAGAQQQHRRAVQRGLPLAERLLQRQQRLGRPFVDLELDRAYLKRLTPHYYTLLSRMENENLAHRLQGGRYLLELSGYPAEAPLVRSLEQLAPALLQALGHDYYLSWHTALYHYGLIEAQSSTVFAATARKKRRAEFSGYKVEFVVVPESRMESGRTVVTGAEGPINLATVERALVDSFDRPRYAGSFPVVAQALRQAWRFEELDPEQLVQEVLAFDKHALARRLGFFMERWEIPGAEALRPHLGRGYAVPLSPGGLGYMPGVEVDSKWGVVLDHDLIYTAEHLK